MYLQVGTLLEDHTQEAFLRCAHLQTDEAWRWWQATVKELEIELHENNEKSRLVRLS